MSLDVGPLVLHHQSDIMLRRLSSIHQHQFRGLIDGNLAHHLTTNTTGRASNHDAFACQLFTHRFHVHLNLITWQQVLNTNLAQLWCRRHNIARGFHLFLLLRDIQTDTSVNQFLLEVLLLTECVHALRRHDDSLNLLLLQDVNQVFINIIHLLTHHDVSIHLLVDGGKTLQVEAHRLLAADMLANGDSVTQHTKDKRALSSLVGKQQVVQTLHGNTLNPDDDGGHQERCKDLSAGNHLQIHYIKMSEQRVCGH